MRVGVLKLHKKTSVMKVVFDMITLLQCQFKFVCSLEPVGEDIGPAIKRRKKAREPNFCYWDKSAK